MRLSLLTLGVALLLATVGHGQQNPAGLLPRLDTVTPPGGKVGTTIELTCSGSEISEPTGLLFGHPGIKGELLPPPPPPPPDPKKPNEKPKAPESPPKFRVVIAPDVPVGIYDVRVVCKLGVSNPRAFVVGEYPEISEKEPNNDVAEAQRIEPKQTINGRIDNNTDVDLYSITVGKGQRLLFALSALDIDSKAAPLLEVIDAEGRRLAVARSVPQRDPFVDVLFPSDGNYFVRVTEFAHQQGGPTSFYRLTVGDFPWLEAAQPSILPIGRATPVTLYGRNLPGGTVDPKALMNGKPLEKLTVTVTPPADAFGNVRAARRVGSKAALLDSFDYRVRGPNGTSNPIALGVSTVPVVVEQEPNDAVEKAQAISVPSIVSATVDHRADRDYFKFAAKKGESLMIVVVGERLGSPADFAVTLFGQGGKQEITEQDDSQDTLHATQLYTRSTDPQPYRFNPPADGEYLIRVVARDAAAGFGPHIGYRLRVSPESPDFRLAVMGCSTYLPTPAKLYQDGTLGLDVFVERHDGFTEPITLSVEGLPPGVVCPPQIIGTNSKSTVLVLQAGAGTAPGIGSIRVKGTATINGKSIVHTARPLTITWGSQQPNENVPMIARLDQGLPLAVGDKAPLRLTVKTTELTLKPGDKGEVKVDVARLLPDLKQPITVTAISPAINPPPPVSTNNNQPLTIAADKTEGTLPISAANNAPPGIYSVVLQASVPLAIEDPKDKSKKKNLVVAQPGLPIRVTVLPTSLAKVTAQSPGNLKLGAAAELLVRVERQHGFRGPFTVTVVLPKEAVGVSAAAGTIAADTNETKIALKADAGAKPINLQNIVVKVEGRWDEKLVVAQEAKFNLNIVK